MAEELPTTPEERAVRRLKDFSSLVWHISAFLIVNGFLWFLDLLPGDGLDWAYWTTVPWGVGLAFHIAAYFISDDDESNRRSKKFLKEERDRKPLV